MNSGNPGNFFLQNFVKFPHNSDIIQNIDGTQTLNLLYEMDYISELSIKIPANYNSVFFTK